MVEFNLPDVGEGIHEAEIVRWLVQVGQRVTLDQIILEIQTDKAIVEIPSPVAGEIVDIRVEEGTVVPVGTLLVIIAATNEAPSPVITSPKASSDQRQNHVEPKPSSPNHQAEHLAGTGKRVLAAPAVRKLALELGLDLTKIPGSGPAKRILPEDVRHFMAQNSSLDKSSPNLTQKAAQTDDLRDKQEIAPIPAQLEVVDGPEFDQTLRPPVGRSAQDMTEDIPLQGLRRRIAERMEMAWQIPHVTSFDEVDVTALVGLRGDLKSAVEAGGRRLTYLPFIIKATLQTLKEFPYFNASLDMAQKKVRLHRAYHIGIATAVPEGLLVPVIHHADHLTLLQLAETLELMTDLAQKQKLPLEKLSGSTFTISNFGRFGGYQGTPIINPPEVAILGCGRIEEKPVAWQGRVEIRPVLPLALSYDHRLIDGAVAGQFLKHLKALLTKPNLLFLALK